MTLIPRLVAWVLEVAAFGICDNAEDFQSDEAWRQMTGSVTDWPISLFTLCEDSSIWEHLMWIGTAIRIKAGFLLPVVYGYQRDLCQQSNGQEKLCNIGISEALENRFADLLMEVVLEVGFAAICDQG
jgi:hypothetical protein